MQRKKAKSKRRFRLNTPAEEARIQAGIDSDPDSPELAPERLARMRPFREWQAERRLGRPKSAVQKKKGGGPCSQPLTDARAVRHRDK
jgi:hypothetical protein